MRKIFSLLLSINLAALGSADLECPVGTSTFGGSTCISLLDHCLNQGRLVEKESCGRRCSGNSVPDVYGQRCRDDSARLRPVLLMTGLKEVLETQLINLRRALDTSGLRKAIRDIEQIPSIGGLARRDYEVVTEALANLYNVQGTDFVLDLYFEYFKKRVNTRVTKIENTLYEIQDGENRFNTVLRNIKALYNEFAYKIKDLNDEIERKRNFVTKALTQLALFNEMLTAVKQNRKTLDTSELVVDFFSALQTNYLQIENEYEKNGTRKAIDKVFDGLPGIISIGYSLFTSDPNEGRKMENKIRSSLRAVGSLSSQLSSTNWELIQTTGSFLSMRNLAQELKDADFGPSGPSVSRDLIAESLDSCKDLLILSESL